MYQRRESTAYALFLLNLRMTYSARILSRHLHVLEYQIREYTVQTSQLSRFGRETHDFKVSLTVSRRGSDILRFLTARCALKSRPRMRTDMSYTCEIYTCMRIDSEVEERDSLVYDSEEEARRLQPPNKRKKAMTGAATYRTKFKNEW